MEHFKRVVSTDRKVVSLNPRTTKAFNAQLLSSMNVNCSG